MKSSIMKAVTGILVLNLVILSIVVFQMISLSNRLTDVEELDLLTKDSVVTIVSEEMVGEDSSDSMSLPEGVEGTLTKVYVYERD